MSNQQSFPDWVNDAAGALSNGAFPHHNQAQRVGQVCPNNYMQDGFTFKPTSNAGNVLKINLKTVFDSGRGKPTVSYITVVAFGKTAEHIVDQLAPGDIIAVEGRLGFYKSTNGQSYPQIVVDDYNGECFWWVGEHAIEQHDDAQQGGGNGRGGRGNGNGGGNGGGGGRSNYGNRGGSGGQQGGGRQGGGGQNNGGSREQAGSGGRGRQAGGGDRQPSGGNQQGRGGQQGGNANAGGPNRGRGRDYDQPAPSQQGRNNQQGGNGGYDRGPSNDDHRNTSTNDMNDGPPIDEDDIPF